MVDLPNEEEVECIKQYFFEVATSSQDTGEIQRDNAFLKSVLKKAGALVKAFNEESQGVMDILHLTPEHEREQKLRKCVEYASILMQLGLHERAELWLDQLWHRITIHLTSLQNGRGPEAQKIELELLLKSVGKDQDTFLAHLATLGGILNDQGKHAFAARLFKMFLVLPKGGKDSTTHVLGTKAGTQLHVLGGTGRIRSQLARCLGFAGHKEEAEAWSYNDCTEWDAALKKDGESVDALREASAAYKGLGETLYDQKKDEEAEAVFERALDLKLKQLGIKPVLMSQFEIQDLPSESVKQLLQEHGIPLPPPEASKEDLANLLYEKAVKNPQNPISDEDTLQIMTKYGDILFFQEKNPEKLLRAETMYRHALSAKMAAPQYGPSHNDTLYSMLCLSNCLANLLKLNGAIDVAKKMGSIGLRLGGPEHPDYKAAQEKLQVYLRDQREMMEIVQSPGMKHSPASPLPSESDDYPAALKWRAELHEKAKKLACKNKSSGSSSGTKPTVQMAYDPTDEQDANFAALLALMGARGWTLDKKKCNVCILPSACPKFSIEMKDPATKQAYAVVLGALKLSMESAGKLPSGPPSTLEHNKRSLLEEWYTREMLDPCSKEAAQEFTDRFNEAQLPEPDISDKAVSPALGKPRKPVKICIGCGKNAAQMRKCSRCKVVYSCSQAC